MPTDKRSFNIKISPESADILTALAKRLGLSKAGVFDVAIRELTERLDTTPKTTPEAVRARRPRAPRKEDE